MVRTMVQTALLGCAVLLSTCSNMPEQRVIKDSHAIASLVGDILKETYGLYAPNDAAIESTTDFFSRTLLLLGNTDGHIDMRLVTLTLGRSEEFLFKKVLFIDAISDERCTQIDTPCETRADTLESVDFKQLPRAWNTYGPKTNLNHVARRYLDSTNYVFLMFKSNSKHFTTRLKELVIQ